MEPVLIEILKQAPSLGVLVVLVFVFLRHLEAEGKANRNAMHLFAESVDKMREAHIQLRIELGKKHE